jgi:hypothetical protein
MSAVFAKSGPLDKARTVKLNAWDLKYITQIEVAG